MIEHEGRRPIDITDLESAINRCRHALAADKGTLAHDLSLMATLYGLMIYQRERNMVIPDGQDMLRRVVATWGGDSSMPVDRITGDEPC